MQLKLALIGLVMLAGCEKAREPILCTPIYLPDEIVMYAGEKFVTHYLNDDVGNEVTCSTLIISNKEFGILYVPRKDISRP